MSEFNRSHEILNCNQNKPFYEFPKIPSSGRDDGRSLETRMEELELYSPRNCVKIEGIPRRNPRRSRRDRVERLGREVVNSLMIDTRVIS